MKKVKIMLLCLIGMLCLTGCGSNKTLTCTQTTEEDGMKSKQEVVVNFKGDKVNTLKMTMEMAATDTDIKDNWDMFVGILDGTFKELGEKDGITINTNNNKTSFIYTLTMEVEPSKIAKDDLDTFDLGDIADTTASYDEVKADAEKDGFTCK